MDLKKDKDQESLVTLNSSNLNTFKGVFNSR